MACLSWLLAGDFAGRSRIKFYEGSSDAEPAARRVYEVDLKEKETLALNVGIDGTVIAGGYVLVIGIWRLLSGPGRPVDTNVPKS